ncbi:MAG: NUMOD3 domain-containing DNA-binding protein [Sulfuricaulis sp.]|nr:NUMOD3 domain-containing DNA-binding protein [Sulfuricaulis sp.]
MKSVVNRRACSIYALFDPRDINHVRYVGKTVQAPAKRLSEHIWRAQSLKQRTPDYRCRWIRSLLAVGVSPGLRILEVVDLDEELTAERRWIALLKTSHRLTNLTDGGEGMSGYVPSDETKRKIGAANRGRVLSDETKRKIAAANKGRVASSEHRQKISDAGKGRLFSPASRLKMSLSQKGKLISAETRHKLSEAGKGHIHSAETRRKMSEASIGKPKSPEHRAKIAAMNRATAFSKIGKKLSLVHRAKLSESLMRYWALRKQS